MVVNKRGLRIDNTFREKHLLGVCWKCLFGRWLMKNQTDFSSGRSCMGVAAKAIFHNLYD